MEPLTREQFEPVRTLLESARRRTRPRLHDLFDVFRAVMHFVDTGGPWRTLPPEFPPWRTVHEYYTQWTLRRFNEESLLEQAFQLLGRADLLAKLRIQLRKD
jgi:transposase